MWTFPSARRSDVPVFSSKGQSSRSQDIKNLSPDVQFRFSTFFWVRSPHLTEKQMVKRMGKIRPS